MTQSEDLLTVIETRIAAAEQALLAATGGTTVCQLDKAGRATLLALLEDTFQIEQLDEGTTEVGGNRFASAWLYLRRRA